MGQLDRTQRSRAWNDGKVTAHHGIIPTLEPANLSAMSEKELAVYRLIRGHYLAQFLPHHEFDRTVAQLSCGQQSLVAVRASRSSSRLAPGAGRVRREGRTMRMARTRSAARCCLRCVTGWHARSAEADIKALKTMPPKPYTQGELVKAMKGVAQVS
jgi:DNA topoisomerase-3